MDHECRCSPTPIACDLSALSPAERVEHQRLVEQVVSSAEAIVETADGYRFTHRAHPDLTATLARWAVYERRCCPFLCFELQIADGSTTSLTVRGPVAAKPILRQLVGKQG